MILSAAVMVFAITACGAIDEQNGEDYVQEEIASPSPTPEPTPTLGLAPPFERPSPAPIPTPRPTVTLADIELPASVAWLVEPTWEFDFVFNFRGGMAAVEINNESGEIHIMGYVNRLGEIVIPLEHRHWAPHYTYRGGPPFAYGSVGIYSLDHDAVAFFDTDGTQITPFMFGDARNFSEGLAAVSIGDWESGFEWGFVDPSVNIVIPTEFEQATYFSEGLAAVARDGRWGFIDTTGNVVIPFEFDIRYRWIGFDVPMFSDGVAAMWLWDKDATPDNWEAGARIGQWGVIDAAGNVIVPFIYDEMHNFSEGLAAVRIDGQWGFIDSTGTEVVPPMYEWVDDFSEGLAAASKEPHRWGFIDALGNEVIPFGYVGVSNFSGGMAAVARSHSLHDRTQWQWGFVDRFGSVIVSPQFIRVQDFSYGLAAVQIGSWLGGQWGFVDKEGNVVIPIVFDDAHSFSEGLAWVRLGDRWGILEIISGR